MNEREFASKLLEDKAYLQQVCLNVPEDVLRKMVAVNKAAAEANKRGEQAESDGNIGKELCEYFIPAAQSMGYAMDPATLAAEIDSQMNPKGVFAKLKYTIRFGKAVNKANKKHGIK